MYLILQSLLVLLTWLEREHYIDNETVTGSSSGITALVKTWNAVSGELVISNSTGDFVMGENITGSESGAVYQLKVEQTDNTVDEYPSNLRD